MRTKILGIIALFLCPLAVNAQVERGENGEIEEQSIEIKKDLTIKLPQVNKPLEINRSTIEPNKPEPQTYQYNDFKLNLPDVNSKVKVASMPSEGVTVPNNSYVQAGIGTYLTTYLEAWHHQNIGKEAFIDAHLKHLASYYGPVSVIPSGNSHNGIDINGKYFMKKVTLSADAEYARNRFNFYGYRPNSEGSKISDDSVKQVFNIAKIGLSLKSSEVNNPFQWNALVQYYFWNNSFNASENEVVVNTSGAYSFSKELAACLDWDNSFTTRKDVLGSQGRNLVQLRPRIQYQTSTYSITAGINLAVENDTLSPKNNFHVYPNIKAEYAIIPNKLTAFIVADGDMRKQNMRLLTERNPWLAPNLVLAHTNDAFRFYGGLKGNIASRVSYQVQGGITQVKQLGMFYNDFLNPAQFRVLYADGNITQFKFNTQYNSQTGITTGGGFEVNSYDLKKETKALALPSFIMNVHGAYVYKEKCTSQIDIHYYGSTNAVIPTSMITNELTTVKSFVNVDLKFAYQYTKPLGFTFSVLNLLNQKNPVFYNYSNRGILFMVGASYKF